MIAAAVTDEENSPPTLDDLHAILAPHRIFKIRDYASEPRPVYNSAAWTASTREFPERFRPLKTLYESENVKVKLFTDGRTGETVRRNQTETRIDSCRWQSSSSERCESIEADD